MVWYAAYGSNLQYERLMCYINGNKPAGAFLKHRSMSDKTPPVMDSTLSIPYRLYFADHSESWGGGAAFITPQVSGKAKTLCRIYLIKRQQFVELFAQENRVATGSVDIDFEKLNTRGYVKTGNTWYSLVLKVGEKTGRSICPVYTFTCPVEKLSGCTRPSENYLSTIISGLIECWPKMKKSDLIEYLFTATQGTYKRNDLAALFARCEKSTQKREKILAKFPASVKKPRIHRPHADHKEVNQLEDDSY